MPANFWILAAALFLISLLYTSAGLAGGSSYIALLYFFGIPLTEIPPLALFLNIIASSVAMYKFMRAGYFIPKFVFALLAASLPATYFGAQLNLDQKTLSLLFVIILFSISFLILFNKKEVKPRFSASKQRAWLALFFIGAFSGFTAGVMGIGGGIFLGPTMLFMRLASPKQVASTCSVLILANSFVGLISHGLRDRSEFCILLISGLAVFGGAQIGAFLGIKKFSPLFLQKIFALLLLAASLKLGFEIVG